MVTTWRSPAHPGTATVLARRLVSILPLLDESAALEVTAVHQLA